MDHTQLDHYRQVIETILSEYASLIYSYADIHSEVVFDRTRDRYLWMDLGWDSDRRIHGCLVHIDLIDGKIWIQRDGTEEGIAADLERAGIPKEHIVLGFRPPELRRYTGYGVA
ncbi:XisI protein [Nostoc sp. WHI]|uniref:XisI protein n=1 Tax=Nostoc sp. WHI TaxID=2650611 RepID=UPI0018C84B4A|nr:XisI protein [Nostoc sp. WHI]MBG1270002.1 XisI protein [Nostoc sp. WHI]